MRLIVRQSQPEDQTFSFKQSAELAHLLIKKRVCVTKAVSHFVSKRAPKGQFHPRQWVCDVNPHDWKTQKYDEGRESKAPVSARLLYSAWSIIKLLVLYAAVTEFICPSARALRG